MVSKFSIGTAGSVTMSPSSLCLHGFTNPEDYTSKFAANTLFLQKDNYAAVAYTHKSEALTVGQQLTWGKESNTGQNKGFPLVLSEMYVASGMGTDVNILNPM